MEDLKFTIVNSKMETDTDTFEALNGPGRWEYKPNSAIIYKKTRELLDIYEVDKTTKTKVLLRPGEDYLKCDGGSFISLINTAPGSIVVLELLTHHETLTTHCRRPGHNSAVRKPFYRQAQRW